MKRFFLTLFGLILSSVGFGQLDDLMIVEYVDWNSGNGLAVKIYNPTANAINLTTYSVAVYNNGVATPTASVNLSGILNSGAVYVVGNSGYPCPKDKNIGGGVNGNDAVALLKNGAFVDMINNASANYAQNNGLFYHNRLIRKNSNCVRYTSTNGVSANSWPSNMIFSHPGWNATAVQCFGPGSPYTPNRDSVRTFTQICQGDSVLIDGLYRKTAGTYYETYTGSAFCDSVVETQLLVTPYDLSGANATICEGDSIFLENNWQKLAGTYYDTLTGTNGCDSIHQTILNTLPSPSSEDTVEICQGDSVLIGQNWRSQAGLYTDTLQAANGCDSISSVLLRLALVKSFSATVEICNGDSLLLQNSWQTAAGIYYDTLSTNTGCDSVITTILNVLPLGQSIDTVMVCTGDSLFINGAWRSAPGTYDQTFTGPNGCDSIAATYLANYPVPVGNTVQRICNGDSVFLAGAWQSNAGLYTDTLVSWNGCDSLVNTRLDVVSNFFGYQIIELCPEDSTLINGQYYSTDTVITFNQNNPSGCDSTITAEVIRYDANAAFDYARIDNELGIKFTNQSSPAESQQWVFGDGSISEEPNPVHYYSSPGLYTVGLTIRTANGCQDSISNQVVIAAPEPEYEVFIPNSFTPNNDGINENFRISIQGNPAFYIQIFNRWGQKVFESYNSQFEWPGTFNGQQCAAGVYTYVMSINGNTQKSGVINLIR